MQSLANILETAQKNPQNIVLPEATDPRMLKAARMALDKKIAVPILVGSPDAIQTAAKDSDVSLDDIQMVDHLNHDRFEEWAEWFTEQRKHKGMTIEKAREQLKDPLFFAAKMVREREANGMVAGAVNTTGNVIRSGLQMIGTMPGIKTVSSCFIMLLPDNEFGADGAFMYADCGVVPDPNAEQLADIAIATAETTKCLLGVEPTIAMLSFSTYGSAKHPAVDKVVEATKSVKERRPGLKIDGDLQLDAAIIEAIGKKKAPGSRVAGHANVLIFPDLNSGNIAYKLTERLAHAKAFGPLLQGLALPVNDLSRGCNEDDIYNVIGITCVEAQNVKES